MSILIKWMLQMSAKKIENLSEEDQRKRENVPVKNYNNEEPLEKNDLAKVMQSNDNDSDSQRSTDSLFKNKKRRKRSKKKKIDIIPKAKKEGRNQISHNIVRFFCIS